MPSVLRGKVVEEDGEHFLVDNFGNNVVDTLLRKYAGKKIDLVVSVREHV